MKKEVTALSLALALTVGLSVPAHAAGEPFSDVPSDHWASSSISEMANKGIMTGVGNNLFAPDKTFTYAEFLTMLTRQFYSDKIGEGGDAWYSPYVAAAESAGILSGISMSSPIDSINRYDMAQLICNVLKAENISITYLSDTGWINGWTKIPTAYKGAVSVCYSMGILTGVDDYGTFKGDSAMTRAQAAVVMDRLIEVYNSTPTAPPAIDIPADAVQILPGDSSITKVSNGTPIEGGYEFDTSGAINAAGSEKYAGMHIVLGCKYSTLTFTVTAFDVAHGVSVNSLDNYLQPTLLTDETRGGVAAGETRDYVINVSGVNEVSIGVGSRICHATVTDIYLW